MCDGEVPLTAEEIAAIDPDDKSPLIVNWTQTGKGRRSQVFWARSVARVVRDLTAHPDCSDVTIER